SGSECTVRPSGSSSTPGLPPSRGDELEPDIEDSDQAREGPPLECVAVVLARTACRLRPVAGEPFGRSALLLHGQIQERQLRFGPERGQVEILPDGAVACPFELV